jgi:hypothetical protein
MAYKTTDIAALIADLKVASGELKGIEGVEAFKGIADSLANFASINWKIFAKDASEGLQRFADLGGKNGALSNAAGAITGLGKASKGNTSALIELSKGLSTFAEIQWKYLSAGLEQLTNLQDTFTNAGPSIESFAEAITGLADSEEDFEAFAKLSESLIGFGTVQWEGVADGFKQLASLGKSFKGTAKGIKEFAASVKGLKKSEEDFRSFSTLSEALSSFANIDWANVTKGMLMMSVLPKLIRMAASGFAAAGEAVEGLGKHKESFNALNALMTALRNFSEIKWKDVFYGLIALKAMSGLFGGFGKAVDKLGEAIGSEESKATIESFSMFVSALSEFGQISWGKVLLGLGIMKLFGGMFKTFSAMAGPLNATVKMLKVFARGLGMAVTELGAFAVDPLFIAGMIALAAFGFVLLEFGAACALAGAGVLMLAFGFERLLKSAFEGISKLVELADNAPALFKAAAGITAISAALVAFGVAAAASGIGSAIGGIVGKITGSSPIDQILKLAEASDKLDKTATALERINRAMGGMPSSSGVDLSAGGAQGADLASQREVAGAGGVGAVIKTGAKAISNKVSSVVVNNSFMPDRSTALVLAPAI